MSTILFSSLLLSVVLASAPPTLDTDEDLQKTGFGRPPPRHGLRLLKWYVKACLDNNMEALCDPVAGEYGFHPFGNEEDLLPRLPDGQPLGYFTIGNLHSPHAQDLPYDVRKDYDPNDPLSNEDRVLVKYNENTQHVSDIFISEHYNKTRTYIIGPKLLAFLRQLTHHFYIEM
ncbi:unnamed protein product [Arctogadus glacialis]